MPLMNSGRIYAKQFLNKYNISIKDKDGNVDSQATNDLEASLAKSYDVLFEYICTKITSANVIIPSTVTGAHTAGAYTGVTAGKVTVKIT